MSPNVNPGDLIIVKKWGYASYGTYGVNILDSDIRDVRILKRGSIYVFYPPNNKSSYIKRLIGLPGDDLEINQNAVKINGKTIESKLVSRSPGEEIYEETYGEKKYHIKIMPQHKSTRSIKMKVPEGQLFFLGDNRDNSADSRVWGTASSKDLIGELVYVFKK